MILEKFRRVDHNVAQITEYMGIITILLSLLKFNIGLLYILFFLNGCFLFFWFLLRFNVLFPRTLSDIFLFY